eukprot:10906-Heterococcus_DN1.PRE.2
MQSITIMTITTQQCVSTVSVAINNSGWLMMYSQDSLWCAGVVILMQQQAVAPDRHFDNQCASETHDFQLPSHVLVHHMHYARSAYCNC